MADDIKNVMTEDDTRSVDFTASPTEGVNSIRSKFTVIRGDYTDGIQNSFSAADTIINEF